MDIQRTTVPEFYTGQHLATETPTPLVPAGHAPQEVQRGTKIKLTSGGPVAVGLSNVTTETGYVLDTIGQEIVIPVEPQKIFIVGEGTISWIAA